MEDIDYDDLGDDILVLSGTSRGSKGGKGSGKRSGRGGGSGSGSAASREITISKALSRILRHQATAEGLELDEQGFARVDELLRLPRMRSLHLTLADIHHAMLNNSKNRFTLVPLASLSPIPDPSTDTDPSHYLIRANQGHSIALSSAALLKPITLELGNVPKTVVHGTYFSKWTLILESGGLRRMGRNHVHFASGTPDDRKKVVGVVGGASEEVEAGAVVNDGGEEGKEKVVSGMRADSEVLIYVDVERSLREGGGMEWWISDNGVILTEGDESGVVPVRFFERVVGRRGGVGVLWEDGVEVGKVPMGFRGRRGPGGGGGSSGKGREKREGKGKREAVVREAEDGLESLSLAATENVKPADDDRINNVA